MARGLVARAERQRPPTRQAAVRLLADADHYHELIAREVPAARVSLWIATANLKELHVEAPVGSRARARGRYVSVLDTFADLCDAGVDVRVLHGRPPSGPFASALARRKRLHDALELRECPRVHLKAVIVDGRTLYLGSANFTGAGLGARGEGKRNFEVGIVTDDDWLIDSVQERFDAIWSGRRCKGCKLRSMCPAPLDTRRSP